MQTENELRARSLAFEEKHNSRYRYSKLKGKTPLQALAQADGKRLSFPDKQPAPKMPLKKPESGRYHVIRFIRSNCKLDIFGEKFCLDPALQYEYVVATIDVEEQKLKLFHDQLQVDEFEYKLR